MGLEVNSCLDNEKDSDELISITHETRWVELKLEPERTYDVLIGLHPGADMGPKKSLVVFEFLGKNGEKLEHDNRFSTGKLGDYVYLANKQGDFVARFAVPRGTERTRLGIVLWHAGQGSLHVANALRVHTVEPPAVVESSYLHDGKLDERQESGKIELSGVPVWVTVPVGEYLDLEMSLVMTVTTGGTGEKSAIVWTQYFDADGAELVARVGQDRGKLGYFNYLDIAESGTMRVNVFTPAGCVSVRFGLATWKGQVGSVSVQNRLTMRKSVGHEISDPLFEMPVQPDYKKLLLNPELVKHTYIPLRKSPVRMRVAVKPGSDLKISLQVDVDTLAAQNKAGLMQVRFLSATGDDLPSRLPMKRSDLYGQYIYLDTVESGKHIYHLAVPLNCVVLELSFQAFAATDNTIRVKNQIGLAHHKIHASPKANKTLGKLATATTKRLRPARELKVALICDEFSYNSFSYEFEPIVIEPDNWRQIFDAEKPDLFLCESAWSGVDSAQRPWKGRVYASSNFASENRTELLQIIAYCRSNNIPTVFWNKEDPTHFDDRVHDFVETAKLFDNVFTTDQDLLTRYEEEHGIKNIACLPFATQPRLFNPINAGSRTAEVIFAGSWYQNHEARSSEMEIILDSILDSGLPLVIYDRYYGTDDPLHKFPERFTQFTRPALSHVELASVYKSSLFGLNINTVTDSSTMFARRVFELMSSNTLVLSNHSSAIVNFFGDSVVILDGANGRLNQLTDDKVEMLRDDNLHKVLREHTYRHRFHKILEVAGVGYQHESSYVSMVALVGTMHEARSLISDFRFYNELSNELLVILDDTIPSDEISTYYSELNRYDVTVVSKELWKKQPIKVRNLIRNNHFVMLDIHDLPTKTALERALLHRAYVEEPIVYGAEDKYVFSRKAVLKNLIGNQSFLETAVMGYGTEIRGGFYHV